MVQTVITDESSKSHSAITQTANTVIMSAAKDTGSGTLVAEITATLNENTRKLE